MSDRKRVVVLGAAGAVARAAVRLLAAPERLDLKLLDVDSERLRRVYGDSPPGAAGTVDLFDYPALRAAIEGADLALHGAGPYFRTAEPAIRACLDARVPYLDFDDDVESTEAGLMHDQEARELGVPVLKGCGASPGLANVYAAEAAAQLDVCRRLDTFWTSGREHEAGRAVIEHLLHIASGPCVVWRDGRRTVVPSFRESEEIAVSATTPRYRCYVVSHPEPVMLARSFPQLAESRCLGALSPQPANGLARGIADAVAGGRLTVDDAVRFLGEDGGGGPGPARAWRHAIGGMVRQLERGEVGGLQGLGYLAALLAGRDGNGGPGETLGAMAWGIRDGHACRVTRRARTERQADLWGGTAPATGRAVAAFASLALSERPGAGVHFPESWVVPARLFAALSRHGAPPERTVDPFVIEEQH